MVQVGHRAGLEGRPVGQHVRGDDRGTGQRGQRDPGGRPPGVPDDEQGGGGDTGDDVQAVPVPPWLAV